MCSIEEEHATWNHGIASHSGNVQRAYIGSRYVRPKHIYSLNAFLLFLDLDALSFHFKANSRKQAHIDICHPYQSRSLQSDTLASLDREA